MRVAGSESPAMRHVRQLCNALGLTVEEALLELVSHLEDRRDMMAITYPAWRASHRDGALQRMVHVYSSRDHAIIRFRQVEELFSRTGARIDKRSRVAWR